MTSHATLSNDCWQAVHDAIANNCSIQNIHSAYNNKLAESVGYPIVVVMPPIIDRTDATINRMNMTAEINTAVAVYDKTAEKLKDTVDIVTQAIITHYKLGNFSGEGLKGLSMPSGSYDWMNDGNSPTKKIHVQTINVNLRFRGDI